MDQKAKKSKIIETEVKEASGFLKNKKIEGVKDDKKEQSFSEWLITYFSSSL